MLSISTRVARRLVPACVISAAAVAALTGPGVASAERLPSCKEGTKINGEGSTLQELAVKKTWGEKSTHAYNSATQTNPKACPGGPEITYNTKGKTGSGKGMENWYELNEFGPEAQAFVGTDNPPNETVKNKIEARGTGGKVLTIPTLQAAVAIIVHLPEGCTAEATKGGPGGTPIKRLVLSVHSVEALFRGIDTKWTQLKDGGDKLVGCTKAVQETAIKRVVREDGSGTTATFKKSLELINGKGEAEAGKVCNDAKTLTWLQCAEEPPANTVWPKEAEDLRGNGSGGVIEKVELTPSSVGYVNLANARAGKGHGVLPGGEGQAGFWAPIENGQKEGTAKVYADPASNGDNATPGKANCEETEYVAIVPKSGKAEKGKFPPSSTEKVWNIVSAEKKEKKYPLCGFTYDLALTKYNGFSGATVGEATTAGDFLEFVVNAEAEGGQKLIGESHDYEALPTNPEPKKNVQKIAQEGAAKVQF